MKSFQNYERTIHADVEESLSKIVNKISPNSVILDVGCGPGILGSYLSKVKGCIIDGVDSDESAIEICRSKYRFTAVKNLESEPLTSVFQAETYDYIIVADVLEHLANPDQLLSALKKLVKPDGTIIFSVPNITHVAVGLELLFGYFEYHQNGIFDHTHLRFYSRQSLLNKLEAFGLYAWEVDTVQKEIGDTEFSNHISSLFPANWTNALIASREDALTYQWLFSTKIYPNDIEKSKGIGLPSPRNPLPTFTPQLFWTDSDNPYMTENNSLIGRLFSKDEDSTIVDFNFSECGGINGLAQIRIDPVSEQKYFLITNAEILTAERNVIWQGQPQIDDGEIQNARLIVYVDSVGCLFQATSNDPQWLPSIEKKILNQVMDGWIFRLTLKLDNALFSAYGKKLIDQSRSIENILTEHDRKIVILQQRQTDLQMLNNELSNENQAYRLSTSWRITRPLRQISQLRWQTMRIIQIYQNYRKINPGVSGFMRLTHQCVDSLKRGGIKELRNNTAIFERICANELPKKEPSVHTVLLLNEVEMQDVALPADVAVHAHVFYPNMTLEMRGYLENIPVSFHLYVTTDTPEKAKEIELIFSTLQNVKTLNIDLTENRGRDIYPMLVTLGAKLAKHELVLHIHTKRPPHNAGELGGWRRYLMESLLGNSQRVIAIFQQFMMDKNLGVLFPSAYHPTKSFIYMPGMYNSHHMEKLLVRAGKEKESISNIDRTFFPSGDMFWFRGKAIQSFVEMKLSVEEFEPEEGQVNQTLAHAIERMFPYFASEMGMQSKSYLANSFLSKDCSAHCLNLLKNFQSKGLIAYPTILFDHNGGGGTNIYTRELIKDINADGYSVLRVYPFNEGWIVQWFGEDDGMLFHTSSIDEMYNVLSSSCSTSIIINSLYGHPDLKASASNIVSLALALGAKLDINIHDFNAICASPHLLNYQGKYCGVPKDFDVCNKCLKKNEGWYHSWIPEDNMAVDISEWRKPFAKLFEAATTVTFFDSSSVEIVRQVFHLESNKIKIIPHVTNYFKCDVPVNLGGQLQIGVLGTLSKGKGGDVVRELYEYMESQNIYVHIPITLIGSSVVELPKYFSVHGNYIPNDLPIIISKRGINVILMPSIVPETFSYTISEAIKMGLPIVAFDIGAQGNRVKQYKLGKVVPLGSSPAVILAAIKTVLKIAQELHK